MHALHPKNWTKESERMFISGTEIHTASMGGGGGGVTLQ